MAAENPIIECACGCGQRLSLRNRHGYSRRFIYGHGVRVNRDSSETRERKAEAQRRHWRDHPRPARDASPSWMGGRPVSTQGYILRLRDGFRGGESGAYALEHRLVMESMLRRPLERQELVHHIDGDKTNNEPANLLLTTRAGHPRLHPMLRGQQKEAGSSR